MKYDILWDVMRVVLDTSVVAAAFRSRHGASNALLRMAVARRVRVLVTTALFFEYEAVLKRPEQRLASGLGIERIDHLLAGFAALCEPVDIHFRWRPQLSDAADEIVLEAAVNGRADALATFNLRDFAEAAPRFGLTVVRPALIVRRLRA
jgi:putative PIN family toxin of toxin-antitoxin system